MFGFIVPLQYTEDNGTVYDMGEFLALEGEDDTVLVTDAGDYYTVQFTRGEGPLGHYSIHKVSGIATSIVLEFKSLSHSFEFEYDSTASSINADGTGGDSGDDNDDSSAPGFDLVTAAFAIGLLSVVVYRKRK